MIEHGGLDVERLGHANVRIATDAEAFEEAVETDERRVELM